MTPLTILPTETLEKQIPIDTNSRHPLKLAVLGKNKTDPTDGKSTPTSDVFSRHGKGKHWAHRCQTSSIAKRWTKQTN